METLYIPWGSSLVWDAYVCVEYFQTKITFSELEGI